MRRGFVPRSGPQRQRAPAFPDTIAKHSVEVRLPAQSLIRRHRETTFDRALGADSRALSSRETTRYVSRSDDRQSSTASGSTPLQNSAPASAGHTFEESMLPLARNSFWLVCAFRHQNPSPHHGTHEPVGRRMQDKYRSVYASARHGLRSLSVALASSIVVHCGSLWFIVVHCRSWCWPNALQRPVRRQ